MHLISTLSLWVEHTPSKVWGSQSPKFYKWKFWTDNNDTHKMSPASTINAWLRNTEQGGRTSQERWTSQTKIKFKTKTSLAEEGGTIIRSATTRGTTTRILIFKSKPMEDACLSLAEDIMTLRRPTTDSTTDSQPLKRQMLPYKVCYIIMHNGR